MFGLFWNRNNSKDELDRYSDDESQISIGSKDYDIESASYLKEQNKIKKSNKKESKSKETNDEKSKKIVKESEENSSTEENTKSKDSLSINQGDSELNDINDINEIDDEKINEVKIKVHNDNFGGDEKIFIDEYDECENNLSNLIKKNLEEKHKKTSSDLGKNIQKPKISIPHKTEYGNLPTISQNVPVVSPTAQVLPISIINSTSSIQNLKSSPRQLVSTISTGSLSSMNNIQPPPKSPVNYYTYYNSSNTNLTNLTNTTNTDNIPNKKSNQIEQDIRFNKSEVKKETQPQVINKTITTDKTDKVNTISTNYKDEMKLYNQTMEKITKIKESKIESDTLSTVSNLSDEAENDGNADSNSDSDSNTDEIEVDTDEFKDYIIKDSMRPYNHNSYYCQFLWSGIENLEHWELQRKINKQHAKAILNQMRKDYEKTNKFTFYDVVHLGIKPDGKYYVIDGQHRLIAYYNLYLKNLYPIQKVPTVIWKTESEDEFLDIYERINKRVPFDVTPFSKKILDIIFQMDNIFGKNTTIWGKKRPKIDKALFVSEMETNDEVHKMDADTIVKKIKDINIKIRGLPRIKRSEGKITNQVHLSAEEMDFFLGYDKNLKWIHDIKS